MTYSADTSKQLPDRFEIRPANVNDLPFIYSTWLKNLYYGCPFYRDVERKTYFDNYKHIVTRLLARSEVRIVCLKSDPDVLVGYSVQGLDTLHWVYVKKAWRRLGVARSLLEASVTPVQRISHLTKIGKQLRPKDWKFDPFV